MDHAIYNRHSGINFQKNKALINAIAFFDFDGTITRKDTLFEIIKFSKGSARFYFGILMLSPVLLMYGIKIISAAKAKEILLQYFFGNTPADVFQKACDDFAQLVLPRLLRRDALSCIKTHLDNGTSVVVVSASPENWISSWCMQSNLTCIGTKLEVTDNKITGRLLGKNCSGEEKVKRIKEKYKLEKYTHIYAYGNSKGDLQMLNIATNPHYKTYTIP